VIDYEVFLASALAVSGNVLHDKPHRIDEPSERRQDHNQTERNDKIKWHDAKLREMTETPLYPCAHKAS
jgi:hypothetical protein